MAERPRRAARHYEVRELDEGTLRLDLGMRATFETYEQAVEFALGYIDDNGPSELEVVRVEQGTREPVWSYSKNRRAASARDLIRHWGFDVTLPWHGPPHTDRV